LVESKKRRLKKPETVRERAEKAQDTPRKPRRLQGAAGSLSRPFKTAARVGRKEYYLPLPDSRLGRTLNKRRSLLPGYFRSSWQELRQVTWPSRKETWKLTLAVFTFAVVFGVLVAVTDYGLEKLFKKVLLR
jgi:preprotein translocase subunit SecE